MGMKITNLGEVTLMFNLLDREVPEAAREALRKGAQNVRDTAISYAPVDKHNLEKAIKILPSQGNQYLLRLVIDVGGFVGGRNVDEYAAIVHEYSWSKRGPLTKIKSPKAGPRYLSRALEARKKELLSSIGNAMSHGIKGAVARSGVNRSKRK